MGSTYVGCWGSVVGWGVVDVIVSGFEARGLRMCGGGGGGARCSVGVGALGLCRGSDFVCGYDVLVLALFRG